MSDALRSDPKVRTAIRPAQPRAPGLASGGIPHTQATASASHDPGRAGGRALLGAHVIRFAIAFRVKTIVNYVNAGQITPVYPIAHHYIGALDIFVPITGFTASLASFGASIFAASRLMYAVSRQGALPAYLSRIDKRHGTPWNADWRR